MKIIRITILIVLSVYSGAPAVHAGVQEPAAGNELVKIWSLGRDNGSYGEFSSLPATQSMTGYAENHAGGFDMKIGNRKQLGGFPGIQAGPADGWGGFKTYPIRIRFLVNEVPAGGVVLTAGVMGVSPDMDATLEADLNGTGGAVNLDRGSKRSVLDFPEGFGDPQPKNFFFPANAIKKGPNTLTITVTEGSWVVYDNIRLEGVPGASGLVIKDFAATVPPFLAQGENAAAHPVRAKFFAIGGPADAVMTVNISGNTIEKNISITGGEQSITSLIPELSEEAAASVELKSGGNILARAEVVVKPVRHFTISLMPCSHLDIGYPDLQPNVMLGQKQYLEYAADMINAHTDPPMTWVSETAWPVRHLLNGVGAYEFYGPWIDNVPMMRTVSKEFLKETNEMRSVSPLARVRSSAGDGMATNARRAVDGSPMGWHSLGPAQGAWIELTFDEPQPAAYVAVRGGREVENRILKAKLSLSDGDKTVVYEAGPMGALRERLLFETAGFPVKTARLELLDADNNNMPASIMEIEVWRRTPVDEINAEVIKAIQSGQMEVTGMYLNYLTGLTTTEWLARSLTRSNEVAKKTGVPLTTAAITDVPGYSFALPDLLAGAGIKYLYPAQNPHRAAPCTRGMPIVFYWTGPGGGRVLTYRAFNTYNEGYWLGFSRSADLAEELLPAFLDGLDDGSYPYNHLMLRLLGDITDDGPVAELLPQIVSDWNSRWAWPKLVIDTPAKFFPAFEEVYGDILPSLKGDWTGYWEDGAGSTAKETGIIRDVHRSLLGATAFAAFSGRIIGENPELQKEMDAAEENLYLYDEHTWGADESVRKPDSQRTASQWYLKEMPAWDALDRTENAWSMLTPLFEKTAPAPEFGGRTVCVVNTTGRKRSGTARIPLRESESDVAPVRFGEGYSFAYNISRGEKQGEISLFANDIPPLGLKCYEIAEMSGAPGSAPVKYSYEPPFLENRFYRITIDEKSGRITSIVDKELDAEILDESKGFGMNEFLYVKGYEQDEPVRLFEVKVTTGDSNAIYSEVIITGSTPFIPKVKQVVRLHHYEKLIEFDNYLKKTKTYEKEAGYFAFPMKAPGAKLRMEMTGGVMALEEDQLSGASRDWLSIQDAAAAVGPEYSVILATREAPLVVTGKIDILAYQEKLDPSDTTIFSYPFNNYWETNYKAGQGGEFTFSYAITSAKGAVKDSRIVEFGENCTTPFRVVNVESPAASYDSLKNNYEQSPFISVFPDNVRLLGVKPANSGDGIIVRIQETNGYDGEASMKISEGLNITEAFVADIMEQEISEITVDVHNTVIIPVGAHEIRTILLR